MPVTARLLQSLQESLGNEATDDLLAWWDEAATVNRVAVREVADLYYARVEARLDRVEARLDRVEVRMDRFEARLDQGFAEFRAALMATKSEMDRRFNEVDVRMANQRADLIKWMFIFWMGTIVPLAGLMIALTKL